MADQLRIPDLFSVRGKVALVTGGASGIGFMISRGLVSNGAKVIIASRKEKELKKAVEALNDVAPNSAEYIVADLINKAGCDALVADIKRRHSKIHIAFLNSGMTWGAPFHDTPEEQAWDRLLALNIKSVFYMTVGLTEILSQDATNIDPGKIIVVSSINSYEASVENRGMGQANTGTWSYNTSKAGVSHLARTLAVTLAKRNITVNTICPGYFLSRMSSFAFEKNKTGLLARQPTGRIGEERDMVGLALFLCSKASAHVTGQDILVVACSPIFNVFLLKYEAKHAVVPFVLFILPPSVILNSGDEWIDMSYSHRSNPSMESRTCRSSFRQKADPNDETLYDLHPYSGPEHEPLRSMWKLKVWEVPPGRIPDGPAFYWSAIPQQGHWGDICLAPNKKVYEFHFCPPPYLVDPYELELSPANNVYIALDMKTCYRTWDTFRYSKYLIPLQLLLNDLSQHLGKIEARLSGTSGAVE